MKEKILKYILDKQLFFYKQDELVEKLKSEFNDSNIDALVEELLSSGDLVSDENNKIATAQFKGYIKGKIIGNRKGFAFCDIGTAGADDVFIAYDNLGTAINGDTVLIKITAKPVGNNPEGKVMKVLCRDKAKVVGKFEHKGTHGIIVSDNEREYKHIYVPKKQFSTAQDGDKVVAEILDYGKTNRDKLTGRVVEILGRATDPNVEQLSIIRQFGLKTDFDENTVLEARKIRNVVVEKDFADRKDLRKLNAVTIDGSDTRDVDDAISIEYLAGKIYRIGVHIADVSQYVKEGSALDKEAFLRGTSVYFPDMVLPMLPKELSNGICSLNENVDRLALSVIIDLDENAKVLRSEICESVINVKKHLIYSDVTAALLGDPTQTEKLQNYMADFKAYQKLTLALEQKRKDRGAIDFDMPEAVIEMGENGEVKNIVKRSHSIADRMVESFMILTNEVVAEKYFVKKLPFVYRVHDKPDPAKLTSFMKFAESQGVKAMINPEECPTRDLQKLMNEITDTTKKDILSRVLLRSMMKAQYAPQCIGHYGLASTFYCHFTAPIRRYSDLAIHRIIKKDLNSAINAGNKPYIEAFVESASTQASVTEKTADECEREVDAYKKCLYMKEFVGSTFDAFINTVTSFGIFVELNNTVEGLVHITSLPQDIYNFDERSNTLVGNSHKYSIGDTLRVVLVSVNEKTRKIDFFIEGVTPTPKETKARPFEKKVFDKPKSNNDFRKKKKYIK